MYNSRSEKDMDNGIIYFLINKIIICLYYLNIVELIKILAKNIVFYIYRNESLDEKRRKNRLVCNQVIDSFVLIKIIFVCYIWWMKIDNKIILGLIIYLLIMNTFTYFYHHLWDKGAILDKFLTFRRVRRRFIALFTSIFFMIITYGYLYYVPFLNEFKWSDNTPSPLKSFLFSVSSSFSGSYENVTAKTEIGEYIKMSQVVMVFIFVTLILARSMPKGNESTVERE